MVMIEFQKQCACFKRSDLEPKLNFESLNEAKKEAQNLCDYINEEFCQNHFFEIKSENEEKIIIKMSVRER